MRKKLKYLVAGKLEGTRKFVIRLIQKGFSNEGVAELTKLQIEKVKELRRFMVN